MLAALASAFCNALSSVLQRIGIESAPSGSTMRLKLLRHIFGRPVWLIGILVLIASFLLHAVALSGAQLSEIQPLLATSLIFLLAMLWLWFRKPVRGRDWAGVIATCVGLAAFLKEASPHGGNAIPSVGRWLSVGAIVLATVGLCVALAQRGSRVRRAALYASAAALCAAFTASLTKTTTILIRHGWGHVFLHWEPYGIAIAGALALFLTQNAFLAGPVAVSQTALLIVDSIGGIVIGVALFGDRLRSGGGSVAVESGSLVLMVLGLWSLSHSPVIVAATEERLSAEFGAISPETN
jgi:drug/metabolite transporter (DMT)-like permease